MKEHLSDATKFRVRIDPGKAFIEGKEYETFTGTDIPVNKARTYTKISVKKWLGESYKCNDRQQDVFANILKQNFDAE